jgi:nucleoid-associated protein YgaU
LSAIEEDRERRRGVMANGWFQWYQVKDGDNLSDIALWWYGNGSEPYWRRIWLASRDVIPNPDEIFPGQWIRLPWWSFWCHIIGGDTLFQLCEWVYGDGNAYWIILQANPGKISDPDQIFPSMWLWFP